MEIALIILAGTFVLAGIIGSFIPVIPGPPLAWLGLLFAHLSGYAEFSTRMLLVTALITLVVIALDYILPSFGTVNYGGTKTAQRGAIAGSIVGMFFGPLGIILGPFIGAFLGELLTRPRGIGKILKVAFGAFLGFILSIGIKLIWAVLIAWWIVKAVFFTS